MRQDLKILENIDRYLSGQMSGEELTAFENQINQNEGLKTQVENQKLIIQAAKRQVLSNQINAAAKGGFFNFKWGIGVGLIVLIIGGIMLSQLDFSSSPKIVKNEKSVETKIQTEQVETIQKETLVQNDSIENNDNKIESIAQSKSTAKPNKVQKIVEQNQNDQDEFYDFHGLQCWVKPNVQVFEINADSTETIEGREGTLIIIPEHSFLDEKGNEVNGKVNFELVEAYTLDDILLYNLTTTSNGNVLETGGMFFTNATQNGKTLTVNPNKPMVIQVPCVEEKPNMMAFESEIDSAGNINWKNPKLLEKWLTKVDMNKLDFLPVGFENEVYASMPILGFEKANEQIVDSLYQLMGYKTATRLNEGFSMVNNNTLYVEKSFNDCGVNPNSIKIIRGNPDYANSYIATKEFEARLEKLHQLENGQEMLEIYLENLDENLYYSDSLVNNCIQFGVGEKSNDFSTFYNQKKTKVKGWDLYAKALTDYYNKEKEDFNNEIEAIRQKGSVAIKNEFKKLENLKNKSKILRNKLTRNNVSRGNNYTVQWSSFGWANIDQYLHLLSKGSQDVEVSCEQSKSAGRRIRIYQWLGAISTLTPIIVNKLKGIVKVPKEGSKGSSKMSDTYALAVSKENGKWFFGLKKYNPYKNNKVDILLNEISLEELKAKLNSIDGASPLLEHLENVKSKFYRNTRAKNVVEGQFLNRLKKLCFPCYSGSGFNNYDYDQNVSGIYVFKHAYFEGGQVAIQKYVDEAYKYSFLQKKNDLDYKFFVTASVDETGRFENPTVYSKAPVLIKWKLKRVLKNMANWVPAQSNYMVVHDFVTFRVDMPNSK